MSAESQLTMEHAEPDGPGREALDVLYRFVAALELAPTVAVHSIDRNGIVRYWNHTCVDVFGISASEAIGRPLTSLTSHLDREQEFAATLESIWHTGASPPPRDWHIKRLDGADRWLYSTHFPVARAGVPLQVFCMEVDISQRKVDEAALIEAGVNFRQLFERSRDAIVLIEGSQIVDANPAALDLFQTPERARLLGRTLLDFSPPTQASGESSVLADAAIAAQAFIDGNRHYEWQFRHADGKLFWADVLLTSVTLDHRFLSYAVLRDISDSKLVQQSLATAAQVFANSRDAILILDRHYKVVSANRAFSTITGIANDAVLGAEVPGLRDARHDPAYYQQIWDYVDANDHWEGEICCLRNGIHAFPVWLSLTAIRDSGGAVANYMAIMADISERRRIEERNRFLAEHDFLTGLPNRVLFLDRMQQALATQHRKHSQVAVMFVDLDRFKGINDSFGHQVGDAVLKEVATRLTGCVRGVDTVSRQGGDEFVVMLADIGGVDQAAHVADNIMRAVARPVQHGSGRISLSVSIGIALCPTDGEDIDTLLHNADVAMYHAKQNGRNAFSFFDADMNAHVVERVKTENELRHALAHGEFSLAYQPEVDIASGRITGVEALLRWRHPQRGELGPGQFIGVAEECGLMVPLGAWVLQQACAQAQRWHAQGFAVSVAVNLSASQFAHGSLVDNVEHALRQSGLEARYLDLEITEALILNGDQATLATVNALHQRGVQLTIDDFGTGYSSLIFLRRYPLSRLKIDRSFIGDITSEPAEAGIIPAIIAVARSLKLQVVGEGVETAEQLQFLQQYGCDQYQGYYAGAASAEPDLTIRPH